MAELLISLALGLGIGVCCRVFDIALPAPPVLSGALLVMAMTLGQTLAERWSVNRLARPRRQGRP